MTYPTPDTVHPVTFPDGTKLHNNVFLKAVIDHPMITVGDYTYLNAFNPPDDLADWRGRLAPYMYPNARDRLIIGKFGQFADGVQFITHGANHPMDGFSTYPFPIHDPARFPTMADGIAVGRDTVVGHDVWLGRNVKVMPGTHIGNGVIAGAEAVLAGTIPDYTVVVGNPAQVTRQRFDDDTIAALNKIAWWDWPIDKILTHEAAICGADIVALGKAAEESP